MLKAKRDEMQSLNDMELIRLAQSGSALANKAKDILLKRHKGFLHSIALAYSIEGLDHDDLVQYARIGMLRAIRDYDFSAGCKLNTYTKPKILGIYSRLIRDRQRQKTKADVVSFDCSDGACLLNDIRLSRSIDYYDHVCSVYTEVLLHCLNSVSNAHHRKVVGILIDYLIEDRDVTLDIIAKQMGITGERVRQIIKVCRDLPAFRELKELLKEEIVSYKIVHAVFPAKKNEDFEVSNR